MLFIILTSVIVISASSSNIFTISVEILLCPGAVPPFKYDTLFLISLNLFFLSA